MRWLLAGCCGLALIHLSVSLQLSQVPRFYGVTPNRENVIIYCLPSNQDEQATVQWHKTTTDGKSNKTQLESGGRFEFSDSNLTTNAVLRIKKVHEEDSGVYYCEMDNKSGPGTHLKVVKLTDRDIAEYRSKMKDGLIVLQGLLLATCVAAMMLRKQKLLEKQDSIYEEPETDHIYEGLAIETCAAGLYDELTVYDQAETTEAPWE